MIDADPDDRPRERWRCGRCKRFVSPATEPRTVRRPLFRRPCDADGRETGDVPDGEYVETVRVMRCRACGFLTEVA